jgi:glycosyltransferase involved in cell wall biosynthesis
MDSILFLLPVSGGSGGAHSVMQEADAMRALGVDAIIATNEVNAPRLRSAYGDMRTIQDHVHSYEDVAGLCRLLLQLKPGIVVATTNQSVHALDAALAAGGLAGKQRTAYYVQDYEPLFYERGTADWLLAYSSFTKIPGMILFAKTRWLQEIVSNNHEVPVAKVEPSIDHQVYYPDLSLRAAVPDKLVIAAMMRPSTPRRAPRRTARLLSQIASEYGDRVTCISFGCSVADLRAHALRLPGVEHIGTLTRDRVGDLFRTTDLFLDLSDFQAFGRTAIEAMSCGAAAIVPAHGGAYEYAEDGRNCFVADTRSDDSVLAVVGRWLQMSDAERRMMMFDAIRTGYRYSPETAALSEIEVLRVDTD